MESNSDSLINRPRAAFAALVRIAGITVLSTLSLIAAADDGPASNDGGHLGNVVVETAQGMLLGDSIGENRRRVHVFRGIPYAVPPVGTRRWKPAEAAPGWSGKRLAVQFSPECIQPPLPERSFFYRPVAPMSEDCLYLNIWTPAERGDELPVMVWIHGGSLVEGSGSSPAYDGVALARKGVIVVSINYRLGIFGYFAHPELSAESPRGVSGNYGITDQILALQWVRRHIAAFGGDPDNVTVFGESSGAFSIFHLLVSPPAKDLFHRAIAQSPYLPPLPGLKDSRFGKRSAESTGEELRAHSGAESIAELRDLTASELLQLATRVGFADLAAEPAIDGWILPGQIFEMLERGQQHDVPIIVGFNSGEGYHFATNEWSAPIPADAGSYRASVKARYGALTDEYLAVYPENDLKEAVYAPIRDAVYGWAAEKLARETAKVSSEAYLYYFDHAPAWSEKIGMGAFHTAEISYVFNNVQGDHRYSTQWPDVEPRSIDLRMADIMSDYWVHFAKTGRPQAKGGPAWVPYDSDDRHYMWFRNGSAELMTNLNPGAWEVHDKVYSQRRLRDQPWLIDVGLLAPILDDVASGSDPPAIPRAY